MFSLLRRSSPRRSPARRLRARRQAEVLEQRSMLAGVPYGAMPTDTGEYMLGDVHVSVVFIESSTTSQNTETWDAATIARVKGTIETGLQWWEDTLHKYYPTAPLDFQIDFTAADSPFVVGYEPIQNTSFQTVDFVHSFLASKGFAAGSTDERIYAFNHSARVSNNADWAFTLFVVNDENDHQQSGGNGAFAPGGFGKSFAYPGGRYMVTLSDRPAEIIAHETGHIFWGLDEYASNGDHHSLKRGYYNVQNLNGAYGAPQGFIQQDSLMATGFKLSNSFSNRTLPAATQAHIGWRDSDGDKIIDVLDVAHSLTGSGQIDLASGKYRFIGKSQVRTLLNANSVGNQNDITINRINVAEYSFDNGVTWQPAGEYDAHSVDLDLTITLAGQSQIQIRTRDARTGVVSDLFSAATSQPTSISPAGISGFVYRDQDADGVWDSTETSLADRTVRLVDANGTPLGGPAVLDPSSYAYDTNLSRVIPQATLSIIGDFGASNVQAYDATYGTTTSRMFGGVDVLETLWSPDKRLKINFNTAVKQVSIDVIGTSTSSSSYGRFEIFDSSNRLLGRYTSGPLALGQTQAMLLASESNIAYAVASGHVDSMVALDRLVVGAATSTTTNAMGAYILPNLAAGTHYVQAVSPERWESTAPTSGVQQVSLSALQLRAAADFGQVQVAYGWQNAVDIYDVNGDSHITPLDALIVINNLNAFGARDLPELPSGEVPPYFVDVTGDGFCSPQDALAVIIRLNSGGSSEPTAVMTSPATVPVGGSPPPQSERAEELGSAGLPASRLIASAGQLYDAALLELAGEEPSHDGLANLADEPSFELCFVELAAVPLAPDPTTSLTPQAGSVQRRSKQVSPIAFDAVAAILDATVGDNGLPPG